MTFSCIITFSCHHNLVIKVHLLPITEWGNRHSDSVSTNTTVSDIMPGFTDSCDLSYQYALSTTWCIFWDEYCYFHSIGESRGGFKGVPHCNKQKVGKDLNTVLYSLGWCSSSKEDNGSSIRRQSVMMTMMSMMPCQWCWTGSSVYYKQKHNR